MLDDFFMRALIAASRRRHSSPGLWAVSSSGGVSPISGIRCAHAALLGVAMAFLLELNITISVFVRFGDGGVLPCSFCRNARHWPRIPCSGCLPIQHLALGLVVLAFMTWVRVDLMGFLFGDILAVSVQGHPRHIYRRGALVLAVLAMIWRPLFAATVNPNWLKPKGIERGRYNIDLHAAHGERDRDRHEDRRRASDHRLAHHSGRRGAPLCDSLRNRWRFLAHSLSVSCPWLPGFMVRWNGTRHRDRASSSRRLCFFIFSVSPLAGVLVRENRPGPFPTKDRTHGKQSSRASGSDQEPVPRHGGPGPGKGSSQRLHDPRPAAGAGIPSTAAGLPRTRQAGGVRPRPSPRERERLRIACRHPGV